MHEGLRNILLLRVGAIDTLILESTNCFFFVFRDANAAQMTWYGALGYTHTRGHFFSLRPQRTKT